jgi:hypothetical protein
MDAEGWRHQYRAALIARHREMAQQGGRIIVDNF